MQVLSSHISTVPPLQRVQAPRTQGSLWAFRRRVEAIFEVARPLIFWGREHTRPDGTRYLDKTMSTSDLLTMAEHPADDPWLPQSPRLHPEAWGAIVRELIDVFRFRMDDVLDAFGLDEYAMIPPVYHVAGTPEHLTEYVPSDPHTPLRTVGRILLHPDTWPKLEILAREHHRHFHEPLMIASWYRSDAYQLYLLVYHASRVDDPAFSSSAGKKLARIRPLSTVLQTVAPPHCSEHAMCVPAFDVQNFMGGDARIRMTERWIRFCSRARELGIHESYPRGTINAWHGEPWHFSDRGTLHRGYINKYSRSL